jgi:hypothetical protein
VVVVVASGVLRSVFGRLLGSLATGGLVGSIAWFLSNLLPIGVGAGVLGFLFAMLLGGASRGWTAGGGGWVADSGEADSGEAAAAPAVVAPVAGASAAVAAGSAAAVHREVGDAVHAFAAARRSPSLAYPS